MTNARAILVGAIVAVSVVVGVSCVTPDSADLPAAAARPNPSALVLIPGGVFPMGSPYDPALFGEPDDGFSDEHPEHDVRVDPFYLEATEVSNDQYRRCVLSGACDDPVEPDTLGRDNGFLDPAWADYPVVNVTREDAESYCAWIERRLPTEAEWEKAAAGGLENRRFPWGDDTPTCLDANVLAAAHVNDRGEAIPAPCVGESLPVGEDLAGVSAEGVRHLSGNVAEWVADRFAPAYYDAARFPDNGDNPRGPAVGDRYVVRGGSFMSPPYLARAAYRENAARHAFRPDLGFRCAADPPG
ncbi:formylglycine-generating enzyme family protein [bacterium]|nr:formylglycine-generating enzyme family protein [bacterium]